MGLPAGILTKGQSIEESTDTSTNTVTKTEDLPKMPISKNRKYENTTVEISFAQWMVTMILYTFPVVNIVYLIASLLTEKNQTKKNWLKAAIIMTVFSIISFIIMIIILKNITVSQLFEMYSQYQS